MNPIPCFSQSYAEARKKFFSAARARGAQISQRVHPSERGAEGEELAMDLALLGNPRAPTLLLLTSATHGVEGFCGSISVLPSFTAVEIGEHPVACAPKNFTGFGSTMPS